MERVAISHTEFDETWHGTAVSPTTVERALGRLVHDLTEPGDAGGTHPHSRSSVLNLVVHSAGDTEDAQVIEALKDLADHFPSRTLVLTTDPSHSESRLDAWGTAHYHLRPGMLGRVCYEEARLVALGELAHHLVSIAQPLLVPDLPVVLWWLDGVPEPTDELLGLCGRLIVRSDALALADVVGLARLVEVTHPRLAVGDLTWGALAIWRDLLAQLFDPPPARPYLTRLTHVRLRYATGAEPWEALLLLGWLSSRLGWSGARGRPRTGGVQTLLMSDASGGSIEVVLDAVDGWDKFSEGCLLAVTLESRTDEGLAQFEVACHDDGVCASQRSVLPTGNSVTRMAPLAVPSLATLLGRELGVVGRDPAYEASLAIAVAIPR
jgi:glucose-6-phosphate dehydrogenase assembly protein OpcA